MSCSRCDQWRLRPCCDSATEQQEGDEGRSKRNGTGRATGRASCIVTRKHTFVDTASRWVLPGHILRGLPYFPHPISNEALRRVNYGALRNTSGEGEGAGANVRSTAHRNRGLVVYAGPRPLAPLPTLPPSLRARHPHNGQVRSRTHWKRPLRTTSCHSQVRAAHALPLLGVLRVELRFGEASRTGSAWYIDNMLKFDSHFSGRNVNVYQSGDCGAHPQGLKFFSGPQGWERLVWLRREFQDLILKIV